MPIAYDNIIFGLQRTGGISVYWSELLRRIDPAQSFIVEPRSAAENVTWKLVSSRFDVRVESMLPASIDRYLPVLPFPRRYEVFHSSYYRVPLSRTPSIVTLYDFAYERFRTGLARRLHSWQKRLAVKRSRRIICISESTRRDLLEYYGAEYDDRTSVVYLGVSEQFQERSDARAVLLAQGHTFLEAGRPYLLFVGGRRHYKGFDAAVEATARLSDYDLVVIGGEPWDDVDTAFVAKYGCVGTVHVVGTVLDDLLPLWYSAAGALLYLSSYEGFGLPVLEAAMCGCPVIAQNASSMPEVHGFPSLLLERLDSNEVAERVHDLEDSGLRQRVIEASRAHASTFTWERCWRETERLYDTV
jgi:glycosyltransferase involved in cell wall biosynthesis